jgi:membrane fusion protein, heavy metal efflux system
MTVVAVVSLIGAVGVHSVGHIDGWLKSGSEPVGTDAKAQGSDAAAGRAAAPVGAPSLELNDRQLATAKFRAVGEYVFPEEKSVDAGAGRG